MRKPVPWLITIFTVAGFVAAASAQSKLDRRTTIDVTSAAPRDVYGSLAQTLECKLALPTDLDKPVTMHLENVTVRTALTAISESLGCRWALEGEMLLVRPETLDARVGGVLGGVPGGVAGGVPGGVTGGVVGGVPGGVIGGVPRGLTKAGLMARLERRTPARFRFENTPLREVLAALGSIADMQIDIEEPPGDPVKVNVDLGGRTVMAALKAVQEQAGWTYHVLSIRGADGSNGKLVLKMLRPERK
jgi:outer membrane lipoprotein SlyB